MREKNKGLPTWVRPTWDSESSGVTAKTKEGIMWIWAIASVQKQKEKNGRPGYVVDSVEI